MPDHGGMTSRDTDQADKIAENRRARSPRGQGERLRGEILAAVARLLDQQVRRPDLNLSLREVARETGVATQSMYLHFESKEALAWAVAADGYDRLIETMRAAGHDTRTAADRLRAQAHAFWRFAQDNRGVFRLMFGHDIGHLDPNITEHPGARLYHQWLEAVRACEAEGHTWPAGAERAVEELWSGLLGRYALFSTTFGKTHPGQTDTRSLREFTDHLLDRMLAE